MRLLILFISILHFKSSTAQRFVLSNSKQNIIYVGVENPMEFLSDKFSCENIAIYTNNGTIKRHGCYFTIQPDSVGEVRISLLQKTKNASSKKVTLYTFRAKSIYDNRNAYLGTVRNDTMPMASIRAMGGIAVTNFSDFETPLPIKGFTITIVYKNKGEVIELYNETGFYSDAVKEALGKLEPNDFISFTNITLNVPNYIGNAAPFYIVAN